MKICSVCNIEKQDHDFYKNKKKSGLVYLRGECKLCNSQKTKKYYTENKEKIIKRVRTYETENREIVQKKKREYEKQNAEKVKEYKARWAENNKEKRKISCANYHKKMYADKEYRVLSSLKSCFRIAIRRSKNSSKFSELNYNVEELIKHLESTWIEGMSWDNYGKNGWHIDHIRPLSSFDLSNKQHMLDAWKLDNLRALWASDNLKKSSIFNGIKHKYGNHRKQEITQI
jgi:hypothetical protein